MSRPWSGAPTDEPLTRERHHPWLGLVLVALVAGGLAVGFWGVPRDQTQLSEIARHALRIALPVWGQGDPVNEVVYGSRGFDTFGETFILLAAVIAVTTLARSKEARSEYVGEATAGRREQAEVGEESHGIDDAEEQEARSAETAEKTGDEPLPDPDRIPLGEPAPELAEAMTVVVRVAARIAAVVLAVAGVYMAAWGYTPGGGFPAGVALTGIALLIYTAFGHRAVNRVVRPSVLEPLEVAGALVIVAVALVGLAEKGALLANWLPIAEPETILAGGTNQLFSAAELIEVATGLTIAVFGLLGMGHDWTADE